MTASMWLSWHYKVRASSSQHALGWGGPLHFCTVLIGKGSKKGYEKTAWTEGDGSLGKLKKRVYSMTVGGGKGEELKRRNTEGNLQTVDFPGPPL
jgi:hypothetical protein